ncbi:hypothetical protein L202_03501 [Cryptococcus amylolentus CBS 6039]|uniref:Sulfatase-modifying factor enzyme domain-containing protein n=1 Tax=Cryptococcus amylolentus CBS 6039 TaxID=1295533 RepID=A0A1E3HT75_9TREE|nr:hypothetical protein L202_03501 [Cryptococcus amylolentus CBS 6039]ODN79544.1 hypothetical protein L202_03501 [Cryptococcus amylolentus CBS 6039]
MSAIFTLPHRRPSEQDDAAWSISREIETGLRGTPQPTVPGSTPEDNKWAFKRSVPTVVLYDEEGLRLYDKITSDAPEYYLFNDELNLLKDHGKEIARYMGFQGGKEEHGHQETGYQSGPESNWKPGRWGDAAVGKHNVGVNGEEGLGGGWKPGWDVVELGAGALRKTAHLLTALTDSLPPAPSDAASIPAPITYHPLDLSYPELDRVLKEMNDAIGDKIDGKVACVGLHGDYEAGLQYIREGRLAELRDNLAGGTGLFEGTAPQAIPARETVTESPTASPLSSHIMTPREGTSCLPPLDDDSISHKRSSSAHSTSSESAEERFKIYMGNAQTQQQVREGEASSGGGKNTPSESIRPLHYVFLGSSLGNFDRPSAAPFLKSLPLRPGDTLLLGLDGRPAPGPEGNEKVRVAYNDPSGHTRRFEEHGWDIVKQELGIKGNVEFVGRYNEKLGRHEAYYRSKERQTIHLGTYNEDITLEKGELLNIEWSYKYSHKEAMDLFTQADLRVINSWKAPSSDYHLYLLERPSVRFIAPPTNDIAQDKMSALSMHDSVSGGCLEKVKGIPKWEEWIGLWGLWDHITLQMIPKELLHKKPIDLRHICLFYLGHIPTFLDIQLTRMTKGKHTEPEYFKTIFERGIDPDVDDPTQCHDHSEVPMSEEDWPALAEILGFRDRVRQRLLSIYTDYATGKRALSRHEGRVLFMGFEHEAMHAETLLYMLAQSPITRAPTAVKAPEWEILAKQWKSEKAENKILSISAGDVVMGHDDAEADDAKYPTTDGWENHEFGWDNEHPHVIQHVKAFKADSLPVTNNDYLAFLTATGALDGLSDENAPAMWTNVSEQGASPEWHIKSFYGPVSFEVGGDWPMMGSKLELEAFAKYKGGRLPTEGELRRLWESEEGPRVAGTVNNIGAQNWHPVPPTNTVTDNAGNVIHGHNGGVWEWTDTPFQGLEGFVTSELYPGYSSDFFDGKHFVVIGGSYATIPQIAGRKTFRNWYQSNYKYSFVGGRVVYDI